jgi:carbon storage regulator
MLVLTRRVGEEIVIGDNIRVVLVATQGQAARLGVIAPRSVPVDRQEIARRRARGASGRPAGDIRRNKKAF